MNLTNIIDNARSRLDFEFPYSTEEWISSGLVMENYHKHTTWSNLVQVDSATDVRDFIELSKKYGCKCYFSGEHGYQGEWLQMYNICKETGMRFRYSSEVYWVKDRLETIQEVVVNKDGTTQLREKKDNTNCHMVIIARTYEAMRKLNYIITKAHEDGFYYKPRIDLELLFTLSPDDVYITSACLAGWKYSDSAEIWYKIWQHFGKSFYLEYQTHNTEEQKMLNKRILLLSKEIGIKTIIGLDTHYISEEDRIKRENVLKRKNICYDDEEGWYMDFPNGETVLSRMREQGVIPDEEIIYAMMNTHAFIDGCDELKYETPFRIPILDELSDLSYEERCTKLREILYDKYSLEEQSQERTEGIEYEIGEIEGSGTADYFISNYRLVDLAVNKYGATLTTTSRGSASSYYCSKLLGFTTMDRFVSEVPIYPERFITKDRILSSHQMPDIDLNCAEQPPFVSAARELFGEHGCYPLLAVGKLGEKSGFKLYADIAGIDPQTANEISKMIDSYNEALKNVDDDSKDLIVIEDYITDKKYLEIFNKSKPYQGIIEQAKCHPCGHLIFNGDHINKEVIGYGDIRYEIGLIRCQSESTGRSTIVVNAEGSLLDKLGYVKDDFLIVDVVSIINKLYSSIGRKVPPVSELRQMVEGDTLVWDLYANGATCCLNQCEKQGTTQRVKIYKPQNIKELAAFVAGIRPGFKSLLNGFLNRITYTNGEPAIDALLEDCFHYMLYQEAIMKIFSYLGIPMKTSYDTIKAISKKKLKGDALKNLEDTLKEHWLNNIGNLDNFDKVYQVIKDSARYGFNAPHAVAMAFDSLYEAWMKAHYTSKFYEVTMNHYQGKNDKNKVSELQNEAVEKFGYQVGSYKFGNDNRMITVDDEKKIIYPNIASIKHFNSSIAQELYDLFGNNYDSIIPLLIDIKNNTTINKTQLDILIKLDYFSDFGDIKKILDIVEKFNLLYGKKNINKGKIDSIGIPYNLVEQCAISETAAMFKYNEDAIIKLLTEYYKCSTIKKVSIAEKIGWQYEFLGYTDYVDPTADSRIVFVTNLNTTYSPKFVGYSIKTGKTCELRVSKSAKPKDDITTFARFPFKDGDVMYMEKCDKKPRQRKVGDKFEIVPNEFNWWVTKYHLINA